jgi:hypothetical protein
MLKVLRQFTEGDKQITEYTRDGVTVSHTEETPVSSTESPTETPPQETLEQKVDRIEVQRQEDTLMQLDVLATIYEELLMKGSV